MEDARRSGQHFGRYHKKSGQIYNAKHLEHGHYAEHLHEDMKRLNYFYYNESLGLHVDGLRGSIDYADRFEAAFYREKFAAYIESKNMRHIETKHPERVISSEDLRLRNKRTCVDQALFYFGDKDCSKLEPSEYISMAEELFSYMQEKYPFCVLLDYGLHMDEETPHVEAHFCWVGLDEHGNLFPSQKAAFEAMGIENHGKRYDNAKQLFTRDIRAKQIEIMKAHGLEVIEEPKERNKSGLSLLEHKIEAASEMLKQQEDAIINIDKLEDIKKAFKPVPLMKGYLMAKEEDIDDLMVRALRYDSTEYYKWIKTQRLDKSERERLERHINSIEHDYESKINTMNAMKDERFSFIAEFIKSHGLQKDFNIAWASYIANRNLNQSEIAQDIVKKLSFDKAPIDIEINRER